MSDDAEIATDDLRGDISAAMSPVEEAPVTEPVEEAPAVNEEVTEKPARSRDSNGKFAKKEPEEVSDEGLIADAKPAEPTASEAVDPIPEVPVEVINAPQAWTAAQKDKFSTFDVETQKELVRRETDYSKGIQRYAEQAKFAEQFKPVVEQWEPYLSQLGTTPEQAFTTLIQAEYNLRHGSPQQKQAAFQKLAQDYGVPLQSTGEAQTAPDPSTQPIYNELNQLRQQLAQQQYQQKQAADRETQDQEAQMNGKITEFSSNPEYPHFGQLREPMAQLLQAGMAETLEDAYEKASWANPEIRSTLIQQEEAKRIKGQADIATRAKQKAVSLKGSPSGTETPAASLDIRGELERALKGDNNRI